MSATLNSTITNPDTKQRSNEAIGQGQPARSVAAKNYAGFVAGVFSGIAKLTVGHPFDTIKVRLQTTPPSQFAGPIDCLFQTIRKEGFAGLYKGATPPLVGWMFMDSVMLGSLTFYRRILQERVFDPSSTSPLRPFLAPLTSLKAPTAEKIQQELLQPLISSESKLTHPTQKALPIIGHGFAGVLAGWTVSFIAAPVEHVKARLQIQYASTKSQRLYQGPIDCVRKIHAAHGFRGLYHGLSSTLLFRTFFFFWWSSYALFTRELETRFPTMPVSGVNFLAGGLSAQVFWITSYPADVVKQVVMTDPLGGKKLGDGERRFRGSREAARWIWREKGARGFWRGFGPCFLRAFPANAVALVAFEGVMRGLEEQRDGESEE